MTPEQERKMRAAIFAQLQKPQEPGSMVNQGSSVTPEMIAAAGQDYSGQQKRLGGQQKFAQNMMSAASPKGRMMGNIYAAPTWTEQAADLLRKGTGAYAAHKTGEAQDALGEKVSAANQAKTELAQAQLQDANRFTTNERVAGQDFRAGQQSNVLGQDMSQFNQEQATGLKQWQAEQKRNELLDPLKVNKGESVLYENPADPTRPIPGIMDTSGTVHSLDEQGNKASPMRPPGLLVDTASTGSGGSGKERQAAAAAGRAVDDVAGRVDYVGNILEDPIMADALGWNVQSLIGGEGFGPKGEEVQDFQRQLNTETLGGLIPAITEAGLTPVSDKDLTTLNSQFVDARDSPYTLIGFYANDFRKQLKKQYNLGITAGTHAAAERDAAVESLDASIIRGAELAGYPDSKLINMGIPEGYIAYVREDDRRRKAAGR